MKKIKILIAIILLVSSLAIFGVVIVKDITIKQNCTGYLKRAADANTVEEASKQLYMAISYLEENNLMSGYTSVLWKTPDEDIEFWFNNIKDGQNELLKIDNTASSLEKSNLLMKLRETLMDGEDLTIPQGLSRYPNNLLFGILMWVGGLILLGLFVWGFIELINKY